MSEPRPDLPVDQCVIGDYPNERWARAMGYKGQIPACCLRNDQAHLDAKHPPAPDYGD